MRAMCWVLYHKIGRKITVDRSTYLLARGVLKNPVLAEYSHPFEKGDPFRRSVAESLSVTPTRKAGHELLTNFLPTSRQGSSLPGRQQDLRQWTKPARHEPILNAVVDLTHSKTELVL